MLFSERLADENNFSTEMDASSQGLKFYLQKVNTDGPQVHSLLDKLREVVGMSPLYSSQHLASDTVEPDSGYARTLLDMSNRMLNSNKILLGEIDGKAAVPQIQQAGFCPSHILLTSMHSRRRYYDFF